MGWALILASRFSSSFVITTWPFLATRKRINGQIVLSEQLQSSVEVVYIYLRSSPCSPRPQSNDINSKSRRANSKKYVTEPRSAEGTELSSSHCCANAVLWFRRQMFKNTEVKSKEHPLLGCRCWVFHSIASRTGLSFSWRKQHLLP